MARRLRDFPRQSQQRVWRYTLLSLLAIWVELSAARAACCFLSHTSLPAISYALPAGNLILQVNNPKTADFPWWTVVTPEWFLPFLAGGLLTVLAWVWSARRQGRDLTQVFLGRMQRVVHEVGERERESDVLRESEARFRQLAENMRDIVWIVSLQRGETLFVNHAAFEEITGRPGKVCMTSRIAWNWCIRRIARGRSLRFSSRYWKITNAMRSFVLFVLTAQCDGYAARGFSILKDSGEAQRAGCVAEDITERKRAVEGLQEAETKYRTIFENAMEGIFRTTEDGRFLAANPALARMLGYESPAELMGSVTNIEQQLYVIPGDREEYLHLLRQSDGGSGIELQQRRKDGRVIQVMASARAIRDNTGKLMYFEGAVQDITERKRAEEALRQVSGRLLRLQDEERRHIARELHDSTAQTLAALVLNLSSVHKQARRMGGKARQAFAESLNLAKQCSREVRTLSYLLHPPLLEELGLVTALRHYVDGYTQRSGIRVELDVAPDFTRLPQDIELALFRVVQESLINIHRHSGSATARVRVMRDSNAVMLEVQDEGRGLPFEIIDHAKRSFPGLGVGIAGMQERLEQLGGLLETDSDRQGTIVRAILPHPVHR